MKSTENNLNNELSVIAIDLLKEFDTINIPRVVMMKKSEFEVLKDDRRLKNTRVIITDENVPMTHDIGINGDRNSEKFRPRYLVSLDRNMEYVLYKNYFGEIGYDDRLVEICRFDNPQKAFAAAMLFEKVGDHDKVKRDLYSILRSYIIDDISIHNALIMMIKIFCDMSNYGSDADLDKLLVLTNVFGCNNPNNRRELPDVLISQVSMVMSSNVYRTYRNLYNGIFVKYNFFKDDKYHTQLPDLSEPIKSIIDFKWT